MSQQPKPLASSESEFRLKWLEKEVEILEDKIKFYDDLSFKIKGWAIALWSALITFSLTSHQWPIASVAVLVPILFLFVDASYKRYQVTFVERTRVIMKFLNDPKYAGEWFSENGECSVPIYDLFSMYGKDQKPDTFSPRWSSVFKPMKKASVSLVYWILIIISLVIIWLIIIGPRNVNPTNVPKAQSVHSAAPQSLYNDSNRNLLTFIGRGERIRTSGLGPKSQVRQRANFLPFHKLHSREKTMATLSSKASICGSLLV